MTTTESSSSIIENEDLAKAIGKSRGTLVDFRHILLTNSPDEVNPAFFHYDWSHELLYGTDNVAIQAYRESGKGQIALRSFPLYALMFPSLANDYIVLIKATTDQAEAKLLEIENEYLSNPILCARMVNIVKKTGRVFEVVIEDDFGEHINVRIEAYGKGASIRGLSNVDRRPKIIIGDDIQDTADSNSDTIMERDWTWFLSDIKFLGQKCRIFLIGNNLGDKCIIERVHNNSETLGYKCHKIPEIIKGEAAWKEKRGIDEILEEKKAYRDLGKLDIWLREKMCQSSSEETRLVVEDDYNWYSPGMAETIAANAESVDATLDPASSKEKKACYRAIVVKAKMKDGHWYILEVLYGRWDSLELIEKIFFCVQRWGVRRFGIEKGQLQQTYEPILYREMSLRNIRFTLEGLEHGKIGNKLERIRNLQPRFKSGSVWLPDYATWLEEFKAEMAGVTNYEIKSEFIDIIDALAMHDQWQDSPYVANLANQKKDSELPRRALT